MFDLVLCFQLSMWLHFFVCFVVLLGEGGGLSPNNWVMSLHRRTMGGGGGSLTIGLCYYTERQLEEGVISYN